MDLGQTNYGDDMMTLGLDDVDDVVGSRVSAPPTESGEGFRLLGRARAVGKRGKTPTNKALCSIRSCLIYETQYSWASANGKWYRHTLSQ